MSYILNFDTSGLLCSVALAKNGKTISFRESHDGRSHAAKLAIFIDEVLKENNITPKELAAVAVSKGPGSYTGLRIGVSTAKGIAYGCDIPMIGINTLVLMVHGFMEVFPEYSAKDYLFCPMIDARRLEVYTCLFSSQAKMLGDISADIINSESYRNILEKNKVLFFGNGAAKCKKIIIHRNAYFVDDFEPSAKSMAMLSLHEFNNRKFENTAYFEPFYLKDFVATIPRKKKI